MTETGTYVEIGGRPAVRFERVYDHPLDRVWEAVATPAGLAHWFPARVDIDLRVGGTVIFRGDPYSDERRGRVLICDPPLRLGFTWGDDELRFELEALGPERCLFTLTDFLEDRGAAARNAGGWEVCLGELDKHISGQPAEGPHSPGATPWQPLYDAYVARGMPSGAPVPVPNE